MTEGDDVLSTIFLSVIGLLTIYLLFWTISGLMVVKHKQVVIVERWGKYHAKWDAGLHFLVPFMDKPKELIWRDSESITWGDKTTTRVLKSSTNWIDLRLRVMDFPLQSIITRDNVEINVHPMIIFEVVDPVRFVYELYDASQAIEKLVQTALRSTIGDMCLDDCLASREEINGNIQQKISVVCANWGVSVARVELLEIVPNQSVQDAMHKQLTAERVRRAAIVTADGFREKVKTQAEGDTQAEVTLAAGEQQSQVIRAKAMADSKLLIAKAEATAIEKVTESLQAANAFNATQYLVALKFLEAMEEICTNATEREVLFPFDASIVGATSKLQQ